MFIENIINHRHIIESHVMGRMVESATPSNVYMSSFFRAQEKDKMVLTIITN